MLRYAFVEFLEDIAKWLVIGLALAALREKLLGVAPGGVTLRGRAGDAPRAREVLDRGSLGPDVDANEMADGDSSGE